jgi:hypothetical protein
VLATRLIGAGVDAVVAFPFPLTQEEVVASSQKLYQELAEGKSVRVAAQAVRGRIARGRPWSRPAVHMRQPCDMRLLKP